MGVARVARSAAADRLYNKHARACAKTCEDAPPRTASTDMAPAVPSATVYAPIAATD